VILKKLLVVGVIVLFFGLAGAPSINANISKEKSTIFREIDAVPCYLECGMSRTINMEKSPMSVMFSNSTIICDGECMHPTVSGDNTGRFFAGFERTWDGTDYYPDFWYSLDGGATWEEAGYFSESLGAEYPDVDSNDNGFYGTFSGPVDTPGQLWIIVAEDLTAITCHVWDYSAHGFDDFVHTSISCYTREEELWNYGGGTGTGYNGYQTYDVKGCPFIFYPGRISWLQYSENYLHSDFAIDEVTEMSYAVYDNEVDAIHLLIRKDNFGVWSGESHPFVGATAVSDGENLTNPSVEAHDNNVVIVAEEVGNIVCFYSSNGGSSYSKSTVVAGAMYSEVKVPFDGDVFVCSYIKSGGVYRKLSKDGGATWVDEERVQDSQTNGGFGSHDLGKGREGIYAVWEDNGIYFGQAYTSTNPQLEIISIKGPIGVTATIKNRGDAEATNIEWTLKVTGGVLGSINKNTNGNESILGIGKELHAKSGIIIGFGKISVIATFTCTEGSSIKGNKNGMQIFLLSLL